MRTAQRLAIPFELPGLCPQPADPEGLQRAYFHLKKATAKPATIHYAPVLLSPRRHRALEPSLWPAGMYQYQCVVPPETARDAIPGLLGRIAQQRRGIVPGGAQDLRRLALARPPVLPPRGRRPSPSTSPTAVADTIACSTTSTPSSRRPEAGSIRPRTAAWARRCSRPAIRLLEHFVPHLDPGLSSGFWRRVMP